MITFKKGSYNLHDLTTLFDALEYGNRAICVNSIRENGCCGCDQRKVCTDLIAFKIYISKLISQETGKYSDYRNQEIKGGE